MLFSSLYEDLHYCLWLISDNYANKVINHLIYEKYNMVIAFAGPKSPGVLNFIVKFDNKVAYT